ncbi:hypothetical protein MXB_840 [Myxobolus squamalis]|nr:hypothetical protein MXB_840 [Myxobolus squamalis]
MHYKNQTNGFCFEQDIRGQTNNFLECYNRHLKKQFANAHPHLFALIFLLEFKGINFIILYEQEIFAVVQRGSNLMALALKSQLFQMDIQLT